MFLLSLCLAAWSLFVLMATIVTWLLSLVVQDHFHLCCAEIVDTSLHDNSDNDSLRDSFLVKAVDITNEMLALSRTRTESENRPLLPRLSKVARTSEVVAMLEKLRELYHERGRGRVTPACFVDIKYTVTSTILSLSMGTHAREHRCLYPIYTYSDVVPFPPVPNRAWSPSLHKRSFMSNAVLTMRFHGQPSYQLFCNVTDQLRPLEGPLKDFHRTSYAGYQLRKHVLRAALRSDIKALHDSMKRPLTSSPSPASTSSSSLSSSSSSSSSSLSQQVPKISRTSMPAGVTTVSIRFHYRSRHPQRKRVDVMTLGATV
jgi:hypothetical protein